MRHLLLLLLALLGFGAQKVRAVVTVQADDSVGVSYAADPAKANSDPAIVADPVLKMAVTNGDDLLVNNRVLIGNFTLTDAQIQAHATDFSFLYANFHPNQYGADAFQAKIGDTYPGVNGHFSHQVNDPTPATGSADTLGLVGKQIYVFVLASTDNSSFTQSLNTVFQAGIFYYDITPGTTLANKWKFPSESAIPNNTTIDLADLTANNLGMTLVPEAHVVLGSFGPDHSNTNINATNFVLASIPEPGSAALVLGGGLAMLMRRRRR